MISVGFSWSKFGPADRARRGEAHLRAIRHVPAEMRARVELEEVLGHLDLVAVDDVDADRRELVRRFRERLGNRRIEVEARELAAAAELQRHAVAEVGVPLDVAVCALILGVE